MIQEKSRELVMPRSTAYKDKMIKVQGYSTIKGTKYFKRVYIDGCAELVRYDYTTKRWVIICFV